MLLTNYSRWFGLSLLVSLGLLLMTTSVAHSAGSYLTEWSGLYPGSVSDNASCQLCHAASIQDLNPYGKAFCDQAGTTSARLLAVENTNSDADSTASSNIIEINANTQPGWTTGNVPTYSRGNCLATGNTETAAQAGVSGLLDPVATTTTTTLPPTTTTTLPPTTTTTTLPPNNATTTTTSTTLPPTTTTTTLPTDLCPSDPNKTEPGVCGCGRSDTDSDSDGIEDCFDNAPYTPNQDQADGDLDGVGDAAELGPNGNDANYDGNNDGIPDSQQSNVSSLLVNYGQDYVTLSTDANNSLENVVTLPTDEVADLPAGVDFPFGLFEFRLITPVSGGVSTISLQLPVGTNTPQATTVSTYYKFGPEPTNTDFHWYEFLYDQATDTGVEFLDDVITMTFTDGARGDDDLDATNGIIIDQGGPAIVGSTTNTGSSGCFIATAAYGSYWESHVMTLRQFRDSYLLTNTLGTKFVETYYRYSPPMADYIAEHDSLRSIARIGLAPLVGFSWLAVNYGVIIALAVFLSVLTLIIGGACLVVNKR